LPQLFDEIALAINDQQLVFTTRRACDDFAARRNHEAASGKCRGRFLSHAIHRGDEDLILKRQAFLAIGGEVLRHGHLRKREAEEVRHEIATVRFEAFDLPFFTVALLILTRGLTI